MSYGAKSGRLGTVIPQPIADEVRGHHRRIDGLSCSDFNGPEFSLPGGADRRTLRATEAYPDLLDVLGIRPIAGPSFAAGEGEPGAQDVAILTYGA